MLNLRHVLVKIAEELRRKQLRQRMLATPACRRRIMAPSSDTETLEIAYIFRVHGDVEKIEIICQPETLDGRKILSQDCQNLIAPDVSEDALGTFSSRTRPNVQGSGLPVQSDICRKEKSAVYRSSW
jgi:hypothetical protein